MTSLIDWSRFGKELRLKYGGCCDLNHGTMVHEMMEKGISIADGVRCPDCDKILIQNPAIAAAIDYWREVNASNSAWARFEAAQFTYELVIRVEVGTIYHKGTAHEFRECAIKTRNFYYRDGKVEYYDHAHP